MTSPSIRVAQHAGVCFGVKRALEEASKVLAEQDGSIHTLGELIHNPRVVQDLEQQGAHVAHSVDEVKDGTLIIRAHGVAASSQASRRRRRTARCRCHVPLC